MDYTKHSPVNSGRRKISGSSGERKHTKEDGEGLDNRPEQQGDGNLDDAMRGRHGGQEEEIRSGRDSFEPTGEVMADTDSTGLRQPERSLADAQEFAAIECGGIECGGIDRWPARPGEQQHEWEAPRIKSYIKSGICAPVDGDKNGIDYLYIKKRYEVYTAEKIRAIKALHELWNTINKKNLQWAPGGLRSFCKEEILYSGVLAKIKNKRLSHFVTTGSSVCSSQKGLLRTMRSDEEFGGSSQGQEYLEQFSRECADAMCILSYEITLARGEESKTGNYNETMQYLWDNYKNSWWDVPETLSEIQKIWRPASDEKGWTEQLESAYSSYRLSLFGNLYGYNFREDLLRMAGNGVVEQTAEKAFITLYNEF